MSLSKRLEPVYPRAVEGVYPRAVASYCPSQPADEAKQRDIFNSFVTALYITKNVTFAFDKYIDVNLIEHDPFDPQGRDANAAKLAAIFPFANFEVLRHSFDNNIGFVHLKLNIPGQPPTALADIYRFVGTCIVEHWDVTQALPANATNPIALF
ncbi:MAG: hypothetical protein Q9195_004760 [Heterodermia aff. obscurata]